MLQIEVITLFPEMVNNVIRYGITARSVSKGLLSVNTWDPRDYVDGPDQRVDDRPYGGGPGMVIKAKPLCMAIEQARSRCAPGINAHVVYLSPQGKKLDQRGVTELMRFNHLILIAGRYEGVDQRVLDKQVDSEWSIGDYVLSGGELPAMVLIDVLCRMLPGALGNKDSARQDSFFGGLLDCPHYTRPEKTGVAELDEQRVPDILLSGDHMKIEDWRLKQALGRTWLKRPDLLNELLLNEAQQGLLEAFKKDYTTTMTERSE